MVYYSANTGLVSYGPLASIDVSELYSVNGNLTNLVVTGEASFQSLSSTGNVSVGNLHSNQVVNAGTAYRIGNTNVLTSTALGTAVVSSSLTSVGTLGSLSVTGNVTAGNLSTNAISATAITGTNLQVTGNVSGNLRVVGEIVSVGNVEIRYPVDESKRWRIISSTDATGDFLQIESLVGSVWTGYMRIDK